MDEYTQRMNETLPLIGEKLMRTRYTQWASHNHDLHVVDREIAEARERHPVSTIQDSTDRHLGDMPAAQLRRDNQDYYDRIDPDRRRFRYDDG